MVEPSSNSLLIAPAAGHRSSRLQTSFSAPSAPGLHDTLRASQARLGATLETGSSASYEVDTRGAESSHPLATRLSAFPQTQRNLHLTLLRRGYGLSAPLIREMELGIVRGGDAARARELALGPGMGLGSVGGGRGRGVHEEVLLGKDWEIDGWEDIYGGVDEFAPFEDFHTEMERKLHMNW